MEIDYNAAITTLALVVALGVAVRDSCQRIADRKRRTKVYISYYTPSAKLLLQRLLCVKGTIEQYKFIRLGGARPYDAFKFTGLVIRKIAEWEKNHLTSELSNLETKEALTFSRIMGEIPLLTSDFETLSFTKAEVPINELDQDLIRLILSRIDRLLNELKDILKIKKSKMKTLANQYCEILSDGEEKFKVKGFHRD